MRSVSGKGTALCGCQGKEGKQRAPGEDGAPCVGDSDDIATWREAETILKTHCTISSPLMAYKSFFSAAHTPPEDHYLSSSWRCVHCGVGVFLSRADFEAAVSEMEELRARCRGNEEDKKADGKLDKIKGEHLRGHLYQLLFIQPALKAGTDIFVVDLLHFVQLNMTQAAWKHFFADKLDEKGRERATAYMESIGCYLDLRAKGQGSPENKFMTGATVDDYVMGRPRDPKSKSPGLAASTCTMCAAATTANSARVAAAAAGAAHPPKQQSCDSRQRRVAPSTGLTAGAKRYEVVAANESAEPAVKLAELMEL
eukprot:6175067-Pleurochrysis_carterae.AAC.2